jgi:hypothetical protein
MFAQTVQIGWRRLLGLAVLASALGCAGCSSSQPRKLPGSWLGSQDDAKQRRQNEIDPTKIETRDDVFQIVQFWPQLPWLQKGSRIVGFKVTVYFWSGETQHGTFVPGNILVWLHELEPTADGHREPRLVHMWEFDEREALAFRVRRRSVQGYYYGFPLTWPEELTLEGKQIEIQFGYERTNEQVVLSEPRQFRVPVPVGYRPPKEEAGR